jgi:NADP-dependent 3-hydroxy acid dehydrogenase YdfG
MNDHPTMDGKVIVITGASSGFGKGAALRFAESGASVALGAGRLELLEDVAHKCRPSRKKVSC